MSYGSTDFSPDRQLSNATDLTTRVDDETSKSKKSSSSIDLEESEIEFNSIAFGDRQQTISASDHEDLILQSVLRSDRPTETDPLLQLHHNDVLVSATTVPTSSRRELGNNIEESDEGFQTPTNYRIPLITECPPAPRKPKSQKRTITSLIREEGELYCGDDHLQVLIEVDMWLNYLEDEDRNRIKKARRQAGKATF